MRPRSGPGDLGRFLERSAHAYTRQELVSTGSRRQLDKGLAAGTVTRLLTGVYCGTVHRQNPVVMGEALRLWQPVGAVTGASALHLYAPTLPRPERMDYLVPLGQRLAAPAWVRLRQTASARGHVIAQGVACVEMPRALLDAWRFAASSERHDLLYTALWARVCTWRQLAREVEAASRVVGRRELERILGWFADGATSPLEVRAKYETFADARFCDFEWQAVLRIGARRMVVDMLHRSAMVAVELDGDRYHSTREARHADRARQNALVAAGYAVIRVDWDDVVRHPARTRDRVLTLVTRGLTRSNRS